MSRNRSEDVIKRNKGKRSRNRSVLRTCLLAAWMVTLMVTLTGCGRVVFVTGLDMDELFTVGEQRGSCRELRVYLLTMENQYREAYGSDVFERIGNESVGESLKENALERLVKVKVLNQVASQDELTLAETEIAQARQAAGSYMESLTDADRQYLKVTQSTLEMMFREYMLAARVADSMIADISREVSDDDARTVTVQNILIRTYQTDASGNRQELADAQKAEAKARAEAILQEIRDGMDNNLGITFTEYVAKYNEGETGTVTVSKGEVDTAFEEAAFNQPVGSISEVVETADGYRIIKPIATSDESQLQENKETILERRLQSAYEEAYNNDALLLDCQMRQERWTGVTLCDDAEATSDNFFDLCAQLTEGTEEAQ